MNGRILDRIIFVRALRSPPAPSLHSANINEDFIDLVRVPKVLGWTLERVMIATWPVSPTAEDVQVYSRSCVLSPALPQIVPAKIAQG